MIGPARGAKIYIATQPVDFRKGMDGLAAYVKANLETDPYSGSLFVFRTKCGDRMKVLVWDGTGLVLVYKRFAAGGIKWPGPKGAKLNITWLQFQALFEALGWRRITAVSEVTPKQL